LRLLAVLVADVDGRLDAEVIEVDGSVKLLEAEGIEDELTASDD
jgi:hypothetical protein